MIRVAPQIAKDSLGRSYLRCSVHQQEVANHLTEMELLVGAPRYCLLRSNKEARDGAEFHVTIIDPVEMKSVVSDQLSFVVQGEIELALVGLARLASDRREAWYVIVEAESAQELRRLVGLGQKDLHVTLGFDPEDIHDQAKDSSTLVSRWDASPSASR